MRWSRKAAVIVAVLMLVALALWRQASVAPSSTEIRIMGQIFGSTYSVVAHGDARLSREALMGRIEKRLKEIDTSLSPWNKSSELTRINAAPAWKALPISEDFSAVLKEAMHLSEMTHGAYDITVGPLVKLWGFGPDGTRPSPSEAEIAEAKARVGYRDIEFTDTTITKKKEGMVLDLSSKAPGYAADQIGALLSQVGYRDYLVEIGGEIAVSGKAPTGAPWTVGIEIPQDNEAINSNLYGTMRLESGAVSTSGTYHQFRKAGGRKTHHIMDPRTGAPADSSVVSVTVTAPTCTEADGLGTALLVLGEKEGLAWIAAHPRYQALFLMKTETGFDQRMSSGFEKLLTR